MKVAGWLRDGLVPTIQKKLLLVLLAVALTPSLLFGVIAYQRASDAVMDQVGGRLESSAELALAQIDRTFGFTRENINSWARLELMQNVSRGDPRGEVSTLLQDYQQAYGVFSTLVATNLEGVVVAAGDRDLLGINVGGSDWFRQALRLKSPVMGALRLDPVLGGYGIKIAVPIFRRGSSTQIIGVLSGSFDWSELLRLVRSIEVASGDQTPAAYALLLDREGFIIGGPDFVMRQDEGSASETDRLRVYGKRWHLAEDPVFLDALLNKPQHRYLSIDDREALVVNRPTQSLPALREMGWTLILVRDASEALADLDEVRQRVLWVALLVSLVIMLISLIFARTIGAPIRKLSVWAEDIAAGRLDHGITVCGRDEIGVLARSLDNMRVELKRSMDEMREAKDRYQAVLSSIDCVVWEAGIHPFRLSLVSGNVRHVLGFGEDAIRAQVGQWREWVHPDHHRQIAETFLQIVANVADSYVEFRARHGNGGWVWLKAFVSVVVNEGRVVGLRGVMVDISDLLKASEDMQKARDLAIVTAENKSRFLAIISHEIRTPMNGVIGMLELMRDAGAVREDHRETLQTAWQSGRNLLTLINDVMDFSRLESGEMEFRYQRTDIQELLYSASSVIASEAYRKGLDVGAVLEANLPQAIVCDASKLRQVLTALLSNAVKFTQHGSILLWAEMLPGNRLYIEVKDTGIGIPADDQKQLFQAFGMLDASTTRSHGGTGLGLALSQRLITSMGGRIGVKSIRGLGSSFFIELPVDVLPGHPVAPAQREQFSTRHPAAAVLLIGDLPATQMVLGMAAQQWGLDFHWEPRESRVSRHLDEILAARDYHWIFIAQEMTERFWEKMTPYLQQKSHMRIIQLRLPSEKYGQRPLPHLYVPFSSTSLFDIMLGRREAEVPMASTAGASASASTPVYKLLVVDDNEVNRKVAVGFLRKMGHEVDTAEDGQQACEAVEKNRYDFVFMDCQMPVMDGYDATRKIKSGYPHLPVVAVTANAMEGDRERCLASGMDDYMTKPVKREKLQEMLDRWLTPTMKSQA